MDPLLLGNDYGESSYINAPTPAQIFPGAEIYVDGFDHTAFQFVLPYFIAAYKAGSTDVPVPTEGAVAWYRTTPKSVCSDGGKYKQALLTVDPPVPYLIFATRLTNGVHHTGTVWGQDGSQSAALGTRDVVSIIALSSAATDITVNIGDSSETVSPLDSVGSAYYYEVSFEGKTGPVTVSMGDKQVTGPEISDACPEAGRVSNCQWQGKACRTIGSWFMVLTRNRSTSTQSLSSYKVLAGACSALEQQ